MLYRKVGIETLRISIDYRILVIKFNGLPRITILKVFTISIDLRPLFMVHETFFILIFRFLFLLELLQFPDFVLLIFVINHRFTILHFGFVFKFTSYSSYSIF